MKYITSSRLNNLTKLFIIFGLSLGFYSINLATVSAHTITANSGPTAMILPGEEATLDWFVSGGTDCSITNYGTISNASLPSGFVKVNPTATSTVYTLSCTGGTPDSATVYLAPLSNLNTSKNSIERDGAGVADLNVGWSATNANRCDQVILERPNATSKNLSSTAPHTSGSVYIGASDFPVNGTYNLRQTCYNDTDGLSYIETVSIDVSGSIFTVPAISFDWYPNSDSYGAGNHITSFAPNTPFAGGLSGQVRAVAKTSNVVSCSVNATLDASTGRTFSVAQSFGGSSNPEIYSYQPELYCTDGYMQAEISCLGTNGSTTVVTTPQLQVVNNSGLPACNAPSAPPTVNVAARNNTTGDPDVTSPNRLVARNGDSVSIVWTSTGASECTATGGSGLSTNSAVSGVDTINLPSSGTSADYTISCSNILGTTVASVEVELIAYNQCVDSGGTTITIPAGQTVDDRSNCVTQSPLTSSSVVPSAGYVPSCPIPSDPSIGRVLAKFPNSDNLLVSNQPLSADAHVTGNVFIPSAEQMERNLYKITLAAWDGSPTRASDSAAQQNAESVLVRYQAYPSIYAYSSATPDLIDGVPQSMFNGVVDNALFNTRNKINFVRGEHAAWQVGQPNDVRVLCVAADPYPKPEMAECAFGPEDGTVVIFNDPEIRGDRDVAAAMTDSVPIALQPGDYVIKLHSWEGGNGRFDNVQPDEQWHLSFLDDSDNIILKTADTPDLLDAPVLVDEYTGVISSSFTIPVGHNISKVRADHIRIDSLVTPSSTLDGWRYEAGSVAALCAAIKPVDLPPPTVNLSVDNTNPYDSDPITFTWSSTDTQSCTSADFATGGATGNSTGLTINASGTPGSNVTYTISCLGTDGSTAADDVTITIATPLTPPTVDLKVDGLDSTSVVLGSQVNLTWSSTDTQSCTSADFATSNDTDNLSPGINEIINQNETYTIDCLGDDNSHVFDTVTVTGTTPPGTVTLDAEPNLIRRGEGVTITWTAHESLLTSCVLTQNGQPLPPPAVSLTGTPDGSGIVTGTFARSGITTTREYTITCGGVSDSDTVTVQVLPKVRES